jgi:hypothetical protein
MNTKELFKSHDPEFYGSMVDEVFTSFIGSEECRNLNVEERRVVMKLYVELDRFFNEESIKQENEEAAA